MSSHHAVPENKKSGIDTPVTTRFSELSISNVRFCCCSTRIADSDTTATMNRRMEIEMVIITFKSFMYLTIKVTQRIYPLEFTALFGSGLRAECMLVFRFNYSDPVLYPVSICSPFSFLPFLRNSWDCFWVLAGRFFPMLVILLWFYEASLCIWGPLLYS